AGGIAECERCRLLERRGVEPPLKRLVAFCGIAHHVWPLIPSERAGVVHASDYSDWETRLECRHAGDLPAAEHGILNRIETSSHFLTVANREFIDIADDNAVSNVGGINRFLDCQIVIVSNGNRIGLRPAVGAAGVVRKL